MVVLPPNSAAKGDAGRAAGASFSAAYSTARHSTAQHSTAQHSTAVRDTHQGLLPPARGTLAPVDTRHQGYMHMEMRARPLSKHEYVWAS